jgi:hypothetical protein
MRNQRAKLARIEDLPPSSGGGIAWLPGVRLHSRTSTGGRNVRRALRSVGRIRSHIGGRLRNPFGLLRQSMEKITSVGWLSHVSYKLKLGKLR